MRSVHIAKQVKKQKKCYRELLKSYILVDGHVTGSFAWRGQQRIWQEKNRLKKKRSQKQSDTEVLTNIHGNRGINDEREHKNI